MNKHFSNSTGDPLVAAAAAILSGQYLKEEQYPVVKPDDIVFKSLDDNYRGAEVYELLIGNISSGVLTYYNNVVTFANHEMKRTLYPNMKYDTVKGTFYFEPLASLNKTQHKGNLVVFKEKLLDILNTPKMVAYAKQENDKRNKEHNDKMARRDAANQQAKERMGATQ
jgi:hypothetical protein